MANNVTITGYQNKQIYAKGDTCLLITPFDSFHMITIYNNWNSSTPTELDLPYTAEYDMVFKSNQKEVRVSEYTPIGEDWEADKSQGQLIFKISKENATKILSMTSNVFYITKTMRNYDGSGYATSVSDEVVVYTGYWADSATYNKNSLSARINALQTLINEYAETIKSLENANADLLIQQAQWANEKSELLSEIDSLNTEIDDYKSKLSKYENAKFYDSVVITDNATYTYLLEGKELSQEALDAAAEEMANNTTAYTSDPVNTTTTTKSNSLCVKTTNSLCVNTNS